MITTKRLQHSRRKGAPIPAGAVYVGRPSRWGNPFARRKWNHAKSVNLFDRWLTGDLAGLSLERLGFCPAEIETLDRRRVWVLTHLHELAGKDLVCWCPLSSPWCHCLKCLDGDRMNTDPSNWECIPRAVLSRLNGGRSRKTLSYEDAEPEIKPLVLAAAKLRHQATMARASGHNDK